MGTRPARRQKEKAQEAQETPEIDPSKYDLSLLDEGTRVKLAAIIGELERRTVVEEDDMSAQAEHCIKWIKKYCKTLNPDEGGIIPFRLYDYQEDAVRAFFEEVGKRSAAYKGIGPEPGLLIEKTRQMGGTWLITAIELWTLTFWKNFQALNISRKQDKVDDGGKNASPESLHGKILFMWSNLPAGQKAPLEFKHLRIHNPMSGATVIGEAANAKAGAGGTYKYGLWDETALTDHSRVIYISWRQAVRMPVYLSTPRGKHNVFGWLRYNTPIRRFTMFWMSHPVKSKGAYKCPGNVMHPGHMEKCSGGEWRSPWYDQQCEVMPIEDVASEIDISYERSTVGRALPEFSFETHVRPGLTYQGGELFAGWDFGIRATAISIHEVRRGPAFLEVITLAAMEFANATPDVLAREFRRYQKLGRIRSFGDPSGKAVTQTSGTSIIQELMKLGIRIDVDMRLKNVQRRIRTTRMLLKGGMLNGKVVRYYCNSSDDTGGLAWFSECIEQASWPKNFEGIVKGDPTDLEDNEYTHHTDAFTIAIEGMFGRPSSGVLNKNRERLRHRPQTAGLASRKF